MTPILLALKYWKWIAGAVLIASLVIGIPLAKHHYDSGQQAIGYDMRAAEDKAAADAQTARNLDLQRQAEKKYVVTHDAQEKFFVETVKEVVHDAAPLAACGIPEPVRLRINAAIECASADPAPTCGTLGQVPGTGQAAGSGVSK